MTMLRTNRAPRTMIAGFWRDTRGPTLVEFAITISIFLLIFFAILDFARLGYTWVSAEKAVQRVVRIAAARPAVCPGVPLYHQRNTGGPATYPPGTHCRTNGGICVEPDPEPVCTLNGPYADAAGQATADEIWTSVNVLLPDDVTRNHVRLTYAYNAQLGFVGGPYIPMITAELLDASGCNGQVCFQFVTPLSALAANAGAADVTGVPTEGGTIPMPNIAATVPGEDLNVGMDG